MDINRKTAYEVLLDVAENDAYSNLSLNNYIDKNKVGDQGFVREIVYGVLKNRIQIDYILDHLIPSGISKLKNRELTLLRMGVYQLRFMNSVPEYAAVNETVNLARKYIRGREGFINGVLRGYTRKKNDIQMPDPFFEQKEYLTVQYSVQPWIVDLWTEYFGAGLTEELLRSVNMTPDLVIRVNTLKTSRDELKKSLEDKGVFCKTMRFSSRALVVKGSGLLETDEYKNGLFTVQDIASIMAVDMLSPEPGDRVIDTCAAPGGKTVSMAELMENRGSITAMDIYENKLGLIEAAAKRSGVDIIRTRAHDGCKVLEELKGTADKVLCDVPCSGLGVIRRKPEIKLKPMGDMEELYERQAQILDTAAAYVRPGGTLLYSTCTVNPLENGDQIDRFLESHGEFEKMDEKQLLPNMGTDGFYMAKLHYRE